ncbi:syntaxin-2-like [Clupea harengus]|uniref:Syntaxin-2-like n=1 Tax=Clupea harengus TaxID=7950 RepID=A0A6P3WFR7_CLUHA|nr:syntaxin-2-like [Clupea harengus]
MRDRLAELNLNNNLPGDATNSEENTTYMDEFFKKVGEVQMLIDKISCQVEELKRAHNTILSAANPELKNKQELEQLNNEIRRHASSVQIQLKNIQTCQPEDENANTASVCHRIQKTQHTMLSRRFVEVMTTYTEAQVSFRDKSKSRIRRQLEITGRLTTDEDLEAMLQSGNPAVFTSDILLDAQITRKAMNEIESRHQDILRLEASIKELHEMFMDIAVLVETQGEMMNNIETNVSSASEYVISGKIATKKAVRYQKQARRKYIIVAIVVLVLLAVIALIVGLSVGLPKS